jgi:ribonuclease HI
MLCYNASKETRVEKTTSNIRALPRLQKIVGWFDGSATGDSQNNSAGGVICINQNYLIKWSFNTGVGTNNKAELMAVWTTLFLSKILNLQTIQIIGDSKLVIDWCNGSGSLHSRALEGWKDRIKRL